MAQDGDRGLAELVRERGRDLTAYAYLLCGDRAAAQGLVQDAIVKVFGRTRAGFVPDVAEAYVRRTMLTLYIDGYRRRRTWAGVRHLVADHHVHGSPEASVADRVDLRAALRTLAPQERATVVLRFYEDLTVPEIAERMGLAPGSVKRSLSDALHKLEAQLGPMPGLQLDDTIVVDVPRRAPVTAHPEGGRL